MAGAGLALVMHQWLRMRALARTPADTTAQLAELQSRIRPHFLFNTLNTALALVRVDPARAEGVLEDLAQLFRVALASGALVSVNSVNTSRDGAIRTADWGSGADDNRLSNFAFFDGSFGRAGLDVDGDNVADAGGRAHASAA